MNIDVFAIDYKFKPKFYQSLDFKNGKALS